MESNNRVTIAQAALLVNRSPRWIQFLIQRGDIRAQRITSRLFLVDLNEVRGVIATTHERGAGRPKGSKNKVKEQ